MSKTHKEEDPQQAQDELRQVREDLNRAQVHVSDTLSLQLEKLGKEADAKTISRMKALTKRFNDLMEDVEDLAAGNKKSSDE